MTSFVPIPPERDGTRPPAWLALPDVAARARSWCWMRSALPAWLEACCEARGLGAAPDRAALGRAYWEWVGLLDGDRVAEAVHPVDFAHFAAGALLASLVRERVLPGGAQDPGPWIGVLTDVCMELLSAWRSRLGESALVRDRELESRHGSSFVENVLSNPDLAVGFLDLFTGRDPVWEFPLMIRMRPAMQGAHSPA